MCWRDGERKEHHCAPAHSLTATYRCSAVAMDTVPSLSPLSCLSVGMEGWGSKGEERSGSGCCLCVIFIPVQLRAPHHHHHHHHPLPPLISPLPPPPASFLPSFPPSFLPSHHPICTLLDPHPPTPQPICVSYLHLLITFFLPHSLSAGPAWFPLRGWPERTFSRECGKRRKRKTKVSTDMEDI